MYKLIAIDLDGTLLNSSGEVTENTKRALKKAIDLLSNLTNYMTVAKENVYDLTAIRKLDLVQISDVDCLLIIVTSSAHVESRRIKIPRMGFKAFKSVIDAFDKALKNTPVRDVKFILRSPEVADIIGQYMDYQEEIISTFEQAFKEFNSTKTYKSGIDTIFEIEHIY